MTQLGISQSSIDGANKKFNGVVNSKAFKRDIKLAITIFLKDGKEIARKLYFSTDFKQDVAKIVRYYRSRFQIEFLYRDAKQFTGLTTCQARSENKLDFDFNAALTAVNLVSKIGWRPIPISGNHSQ